MHVKTKTLLHFGPFKMDLKMHGLLMYAVLLLHLDVRPTAADEIELVTIHPSSQKVVENSPVIFTCVSPVPGSRITWYLGKRPLNEKQDDVSIKQINGFMSVLRINNAHIKRHKKSYTCRVQFVDGESQEKEANLKIMSKKRLHKYFPHIAPIESMEDVMLPSRDPGTIHMKCESLVTVKKSLPTWRWIKNDFIDLSLDIDDERIDVTDDGELVIMQATANDSGTYMCVAENNRGTAYGPPLTMTVREGPSKPSGCIDDIGVRSALGETYNSEGDPCTTCTCTEGSFLRCESIACIPRPCPRGQRAELSTEECCKSTCVPELGLSQQGGCIDDMGVRTAVGETYSRRGDPCTTCTCTEGSFLRCQSMACVPKQCPPGQRVEMSTEECCRSICVPELDRVEHDRSEEIDENDDLDTYCTDRDGLAVTSGNMYNPVEDPCLQCECDNGRQGRCMMVACDTPTCTRYVLSRDVCCNYTCMPEGLTESCRDYNGRIVPDGESYQPGSDPCESCKCLNGQKGMCSQIYCDEPPCRNYRLIPGTCCGFECLEEEIDSVEIDLDDHDRTYWPSSDPCVSCTCSDGRPPACRSQSCVPPPLSCPHGIRPVPGKCCEFECNLREPMLSSLENAEKVLGRVFTQQIGSNDAFVQWKTPEKYAKMKSNLTVYYSKSSPDMAGASVIYIGDRPHAVLRDLDPNSEYYVMVNGTLGAGTALLTSRPVRFSLDGRGRSSFVLNDAIGQVFESRGAFSYDGYSLPREFEPVVHSEAIRVVLNTASFHKVEVSRYNEAPCMDQNCGLLRFFQYTTEGASQNVMSLMFTNEQDFSWAKAHL